MAKKMVPENHPIMVAAHTVALMEDQIHECRKLGVSSAKIEIGNAKDINDKCFANFQSQGSLLPREQAKSRRFLHCKINF